MTPTKLLAFCSMFLLLFAVSCNDDEMPEPPEEPELITTLNYILTPTGGGDAVTLTYTDLDGEGSGAPVIVNGTLQNGTSYTGAITLLNETETPVESITEEISEEDEEHQFFFTTNNNNLSVSYDDMDGDGNPIGLASTLTTAQAGTTNLTIILRHEPAKDGTDVAAGDITNAGGETDIEATFEVTIQ